MFQPARAPARGVLVGAGSTASLHNNIIAGTWSSVPANSAGVEKISGASLTMDYNLVWKWQIRYIPAATPAHDFNANPLFLSATDHHLQGASPTVDTASDNAPSRPAVDHDGVTRPLDGNNDLLVQTDIGAYERFGAAVTRGVQITPAAASGSGFPGQVVAYLMNVKNTGNAADTIQISGQTWTTTALPSLLNLNAGASTTVTVRVTVPAGAQEGQFDDLVITAQATGVNDSSTLVTTAVWRKLYLPALIKP